MRNTLYSTVPLGGPLLPVSVSGTSWAVKITSGLLYVHWVIVSGPPMVSVVDLITIPFAHI